MKPLHEDQIHAPAFQKLCDYIWAEDHQNEYEKSVIRDHNPNLKLINARNFKEVSNESGVISVGMCHLLEDVLRSIPKEGNYIVIHRTNDRPFTQVMVDAMPPSVKHIYTVDCRVNHPQVTAIPFGVSSINGEDEILKAVFNEEKNNFKVKKIFACYNVNPDTKHRNESLSFVQTSNLVHYRKPDLPQDVFHRYCKAHEFTMALAGCGADASRQWSSMILGSIPIVTDCIEMRHFEDMPLVYCPADFNMITDEWLDEAKQSIVGKSTERLHMSYWINHLNEKRKEFGI